MQVAPSRPASVLTLRSSRLVSSGRSYFERRKTRRTNRSSRTMVPVRVPAAGPHGQAHGGRRGTSVNSKYGGQNRRRQLLPPALPVSGHLAGQVRLDGKQTAPCRVGIWRTSVAARWRDLPRVWHQVLRAAGQITLCPSSAPCAAAPLATLPLGPDLSLPENLGRATRCPVQAMFSSCGLGAGLQL